MSNKVSEVTDATFADEVLKSEVPVLVDFWASWCGPCRALAPALDKVADLFCTDELKVVKVNVEQNAASAQQFNVTSLPTLLLLKNGKVLQPIRPGAAPALENQIRELIG